MPVTTIYELKDFDDIVAAVREELGIQASDATAINRIKRDINAVYLDEVLPFKEWPWLRGHTTLATTAVITTGTAEVSANSRTVTLSSAPGVSQKGNYFASNGFQEIYRIAQHTAGSAVLTLETAYAGTTDTAASYKIWTDRIALPTDCRETTQVRSDWRTTPLENCGLKTFRQYLASMPKAEDRPGIYTVGDYVDPAPFAAISGLPALSTRASDGLVKTLVFGSDVSGYLQVGDRIEISAAGAADYNGQFIISAVSSETITYTAVSRASEAATADATLTLKKLQTRANAKAYRELWVYPAIYNSPCLLHVDYIRDAAPMVEGSDEPLVPIEDRMVLVYGALARGWPKQRNPDEGKRNQDLFGAKLRRMAGDLNDSTDFPVLAVSKTMLAVKRYGRRTQGEASQFAVGGWGSGGSSTTTVTGTASRAAQFGTDGTLGASTVTITELARLSGVGSQVDGISDARTLTNKTMSGALNTFSNIPYSALTLTGSIVDADVNAAAAIAYSKLNLTGGIVNADVNAAAAIAYSKLNLAASIVNADVAPAAAIAYSKLNLAASIVNADVAAGAAIALSKTNKLIPDYLDFTDSAAPANPSASTHRAYVSSADGKLHIRDSSGNDVAVGSGAGAINYFETNPDAESGTNGWTTYADGAATPTDLTGGAATATWASSTSTALRGAKNFLFTPGGTGDGVAFTITPNAADAATMLQVSFDYKITTPGSYTDGDLQVWIYDVGNSALIQPTPYKVLGTTQPGKFSCVFQTPGANMSTFRVAIHQATSASGYGSVRFDNFQCGPVQRVYAAPVTDWETKTVTGSWVSNTTYACKRRRVGDCYEYEYYLTLTGAPTATGLILNLPSGDTIDTSKLAGAAASEPMVPLAMNAAGYDTSASAGYKFYAVIRNTTSVVVAYQSSVTAAGSAVSSTAPFTFATGDVISVRFAVPIVGLSSNVQMSADADTRVVAARVSGTPTSTAPSATYREINSAGVAFDTHGAYVAATGYTVPVPGYYRVSGATNIAGTQTAGGYVVISLFVNGNNVASIGGYRFPASVTGNISVPFNGTYRCNAGDVLTVRVSTDATSTSWNAATEGNQINFERLSGPSAIAANELVEATYQTAAGQSISTGTTTIVDFGTKVTDSHSAVTTGASWKFTAPAAGKYSVKATLMWSGASFTAGNVLVIGIYKNGSAYCLSEYQIEASTSAERKMAIAQDVRLLAGEYVDIRISQNSGGSRTLYNTATYQTVSIARLGQ